MGAVVLIGLFAFGIIAVAYLSVGPELVEAAKKEKVTCTKTIHNGETVEIHVPPEAADSIDGKDGWTCEVVK